MSATNKGVQLYRQLYRKSLLLPKAAQPYYQKYLRENFVAHSDETDPERLELMTQQSLKDADWVLKKFEGSKAPVNRL